ncbi:MAG: hypothetical protein RLZZ252_594 [Bacteroidota bacterium]|jgi:glycosyltransferase involved in cell wall biosynthesis
MKSISVVHINAAGSGGAFVAGDRLSNAINHIEGFKSEHWIFEYNSGYPNRWADTFLKKWYAIFLHALEKLDFLRFEKSKRFRFAFSHGITGISAKNWKLLRDADIIHLHWVNKGFLSVQGIGELLELGKPVFWTCHDMWPFTGGCYHPRGCTNFIQGCGNCQYLINPGPRDLSVRVFNNKSLVLAAKNLHLVTPSHWLKNQAIQRSDFPQSNRISVISNPLDAAYFNRELAGFDSTIKRGWGIPDGKRVLLFISANLSNQKKGFAEFSTLASTLEQREPGKWCTVIVGDRWPEHVQMELPFVSLGLLKSSEEIRRVYAVADLYITTSHEENLPTTIMEAQCMGVPVVAFNVGGIPEMVQVDLGYCGDFMDIEGMAKWILNWSELDDRGRDDLSARNRDFAIKNYGALGVATRYCNLYRESLNLELSNKIG